MKPALAQVNIAKSTIVENLVILNTLDIYVQTLFQYKEEH